MPQPGIEPRTFQSRVFILVITPLLPFSFLTKFKFDLSNKENPKLLNPNLLCWFQGNIFEECSDSFCESPFKMVLFIDFGHSLKLFVYQTSQLKYKPHKKILKFDPCQSDGLASEFKIWICEKLSSKQTEGI